MSDDTGASQDTVLNTAADAATQNSANDASNQASDADGTAKADETPKADKAGAWLKDDDKSSEDDAKADDADGDDAAEDKDGEDSDKDDPDKDNEEGAPEEYADFDMPDGVQVTEETKPILDEFKTFAKEELNLSQEKAQKLVDFQTRVELARAEKFQAEVDGWKESAKNDKEFGGKAFNESVGMAGKAIDEFSSPEFRELLRTTQLGNHPEVIRTFVKIGKAMGEGKTVKGGVSTGGKKNLVDIYK